MSVPKYIKDKYDIKYVTGWRCPREGEDLRALISMPNVPKPCHLLNPRNLLGATTWNHMRKRAYSLADDTCEICFSLFNFRYDIVVLVEVVELGIIDREYHHGI